MKVSFIKSKRSNEKIMKKEKYKSYGGYSKRKFFTNWKWQPCKTDQSSKLKDAKERLYMQCTKKKRRQSFLSYKK